MNITLYTVGKMKEKYLQQGMQEYLKRLSAFAKVEVIEVADEKTSENMSTKEIQLVKDKEGERLLKKIPQQTYVFALAIEGQTFNSEGLAVKIDHLLTQGESQLGFVIGGSLGLSADVLARANQSLSFSDLTFPHQLMRLMLIEQIYRSFKINRGEPYHK